MNEAGCQFPCSFHFSHYASSVKSEMDMEIDNTMNGVTDADFIGAAGREPFCPGAPPIVVRFDFLFRAMALNEPVTKSAMRRLKRGSYTFTESM